MDYRERIYQRYVRARHVSFAPETVEGFAPRAPYFRHVIRRHFPADTSASILEIGCGHGAFMHFMRAAGYRNVSGIDRSPDQIAEAKRLGIEGVEQGDLLPRLASLPAASIDLLVAIDLIEHLTKDEAITLSDHAVRVLRPGGRFLIHTVNADSPFFGQNRYGDFTHELAYNATSMGQLLLSAGFKDVRSYEDTPNVHGPVSAMRWVLWKALRSLLRFYLAVETGNPGRDAVLTKNFLTVARA